MTRIRGHTTLPVAGSGTTRGRKGWKERGRSGRYGGRGGKEGGREGGGDSSNKILVCLLVTSDPSFPLCLSPSLPPFLLLSLPPCLGGRCPWHLAGSDPSPTQGGGEEGKEGGRAGRRTTHLLLEWETDWSRVRGHSSFFFCGCGC